MARDKTIQKTGRTGKHRRYLTSTGQVCPGGSTIARVISWGKGDHLTDWAVRLAEECEHCGEAVAKECQSHGSVSGRDYQLARKEAAAFGTCFHRAVECWHKGIPFDRENHVGAYVEPSLEMLENFKLELARLGLVLLDSEVAVTSDRMRTGGTLDLVLGVAGSDTPSILGDLKSSNFLSGEHVLQVGGVYSELFREKYGRCDGVYLFRGDRDTKRVKAHPLPADMIEAARELAPLARRAYELKRVLERRI